MSFIVKGINLPEKWDILTIDIYSDGHGYASHVGEADTREAQAIQIPKGHGRIGDLNKLAKLISAFGESLKESVRGNRLLMTERDLCYAIAVLTEHFQEYEPLLEAEE